MYWIEVDFANGKTLRKESNNINDTYEVLSRYCCSGTQPKKKGMRVVKVRAGNEQAVTHDCKNH